MLTSRGPRPRSIVSMVLTRAVLLAHIVSIATAAVAEPASILPAPPSVQLENAYPRPPDVPSTSGPTIAHTLLDLELEETSDPGARQLLDALINRAAWAFGSFRPQEQELAEARRLFRTVDTSLIESGVIFPPGGKVELLRDALTPRHPTAAELQRASQDFANARRSQGMRAARAAGEPLYYFDCDVAAIIYLAVAERLKLPVYLVEVPGHNFVRWQSPATTLNWDPNDAVSKSDQQFAQMTGVTRDDQILFGYLENRIPARIHSYWLTRRGQRKAGEAKFAAALADFRAALKTAPEDFVAANELAWLLATAPDAEFRHGREASEIALKLVARSRRINWLETYAAARAESGDFFQAIALEDQARQLAVAWLKATKRSDSLAGFDACLAAYRQNLSYAAALKSGLVKATSFGAK
jgi:hypothetical protein